MRGRLAGEDERSVVDETEAEVLRRVPTVEHK
jgi:hypothetical protein